MSYRITFAELAHAFKYQIIKTQPIVDHPVYGEGYRQVSFPGTDANFNCITGQVVDIRIHDPLIDDIIWVDAGMEVAMRQYDSVSSQCYSFASALTIALAVAENLEYDPLLLNDVEINLDPQLLEDLDRWAADDGISRDEFIGNIIRLAANMDTESPTIPV